MDIKTTITSMGHYIITSENCTEDLAREVSVKVHNPNRLVQVFWGGRIFVNGFERQDATKLLIESFPELKFSSFSSRQWGDMGVVFYVDDNETEIVKSHVKKFLIELSVKMQHYFICIPDIYQNGEKLDI
jgi:hypothetical protein